MTQALAFMSVLVIFSVIDTIWLGSMGDRVYRPLIGEVLADKFRLAPAIAFYALYAAGLTLFAVLPGLKTGDWKTALVWGALFGLFDPVVGVDRGGAAGADPEQDDPAVAVPRGVDVAHMHVGPDPAPRTERIAAQGPGQLGHVVGGPGRDRVVRRRQPGQRSRQQVVGDGGGDKLFRQSCAKALYVSPFLGMEMRYRFRGGMPAERVALTIGCDDARGPVLTASLWGRRRPLADRALVATALGFPLMTLKIVVAIHWEALILWLKGVPVTLGRKPAPLRQA